MSRLRILYVAVNLLSDDRSSASDLALEQEYTAIQRELLLTRHRDFELVHARAVTIDDIMRLLIEQEPLVLHFAGHGAPGVRRDAGSRVPSRDIGTVTEDSASGIYLRDEHDRPQLVSIRALTTMIKSAAPAVQVVVLNACHTDTQAEALCNVVDCVISMAGAVGDSAARSFSAALYRGLGNRRSLGNAFAQAVATLDGKRFPDKALPKCRTRNGLDPDQMFLARRQSRKSAPARSDSTPFRRRITAIVSMIIVGMIIAMVTVAAAAGMGAFLLDLNSRLCDLWKNPAPAVQKPEAGPGRTAAPEAIEKPPSDGKPKKLGPHLVAHPAHEIPKAQGPSPKEPEIRSHRPKPALAPSLTGMPAEAAQPTAIRSARSDLLETRHPANPPKKTGNPASPPLPAGRPANPPNAIAATPGGVLGELDRSLIQHYIGLHRSQVRHCYEKRLMANPTLAGTVTVQFTITPEGVVGDSTADGMDDEVSSCVAGVIKHIEFPRSGGGIAVKTPFRFVPSGS
jgi:hypothetical protein